MKKNNLLQCTIATLLVASPLAANAGQYPAADFEPKVLYQDESIKSSAPAAVKAAPAVTSVATVSTPTASVDDSKYPAANFEPKVLFKDDAYKKASKSTPAPEYKSSASAVVMADETRSEKESGDSNLLILAALAAAIGFALFKKGNATSTTSHEVYANRETGVTRYLNARIPKVSGVTKYLDRAGKPTNVARYIAKQNIAQKAAKNDANRG